MSNTKTLEVDTLFPNVQDFIGAGEHATTYDFLMELGLYVKQAILKVNKYIEIDFDVESHNDSWKLILDWGVNLGDIPKITITSSDIYNPENFIISFAVYSDGDNNKVLSDRAIGGFPLSVLKERSAIKIMMNFLLDGNTPDLKVFDKKISQGNLFN